MSDVMFFEAFAEEADALRAAIPPSIAAGYTWKTIQEEGCREPPARIISIRTQSQIPPAWASGLDAIITRSTGYDHVAAYRAATGIELPCGYLPLYCNRSVAEQALLLWLALMRKLPRQLEQFRTFHRDGITGTECEGKTLAVIGVGNIGHEIVRVGRGLGMMVLGVDIVARHDDVDYVERDVALEVADIVVCAMNLTADNAGYFNRRTLGLVQPGALFINIARGELSPAADLLALLDEGVLAGVGLDVYNQEQELAVALRTGRTSNEPEVRATLELARRTNVILTPHNAFNTIEAVQRKASQTAEQLVQFLESGSFIWPAP
jgi:D-lactate dehydrogenase